MSSRTRYGWPAGVTPASNNRATFSCESRASSVPSRVKRAADDSLSADSCSSFTATAPSKRPSLRRARQTTPVPPAPTGVSSVYDPTVVPARVGSARRRGGVSRKSEVLRLSCASMSADRTAPVRGSLANTSSTNCRRASTSRSSARSRSGLTIGHTFASTGSMVGATTVIALGLTNPTPREQNQSSSIRHGLEQHHPRLRPVALDASLGHVPDLGDFGEREPAEKLQINELG